MLNLRGYDEANLKTGKKLQANWYLLYWIQTLRVSPNSSFKY